MQKIKILKSKDNKQTKQMQYVMQLLVCNTNAKLFQWKKNSEQISKRKKERNEQNKQII